MRLKDRQEGDVTVVEVHGDLRGGPDSDKFRGHFADLLEKGSKKFLINLEKCEWVASPGVGMITGVYTSVTNRGGQLKIGAYTERVHNVFTTIHLWRIIELYRTESDALESFRTGSNEKAFNGEGGVTPLVPASRFGRM